MTAKSYGVSFWSDENVLKTNYSDDCTTLSLLKTTVLCTLNGWIEWSMNKAATKEKEQGDKNT